MKKILLEQLPSVIDKQMSLCHGFKPLLYDFLPCPIDIQDDFQEDIHHRKTCKHNHIPRHPRPMDTGWPFGLLSPTPTVVMFKMFNRARANNLGLPPPVSLLLSLSSARRRTVPLRYESTVPVCGQMLNDSQYLDIQPDIMKRNILNVP